jgi:hypothetical protein
MLMFLLAQVPPVQRRVLRSLLFTATSAAAMSFAGPALAGPMAGVDFEVPVPVGSSTHDADALHAGTGFKVRLGDTLHVPFVRITPEVGYALDYLTGQGNASPSYGWTLQRAFVGARLGLGEIVVPVVYGHIGYGWRTTNDPSVPEGDGLAADGGLALDLHLIPHLGFGAHAEYATILTGNSTKPGWLAFGLHLELEL